MMQKKVGCEELKDYVKYADLLVIERKRTLIILERLFNYHFSVKKGLILLDLGCGDGVLTKYIQSKHPYNTFHLLDSSEFMIDKAKQNLAGDNFIFIKETFEDYINRSVNDVKYDFIYSANAIHHLDIVEKQQLYAKTFKDLKYGGMFINMDPVLPTSDKSEKWQFNLWIDWMNEKVSDRGLNIDTKLINSVPTDYKLKEENKPSDLFDQIRILNEIGFRDVDCFYKYGIFSVFGGTK